MPSCKEAVEALEAEFRCHVCFHDYDGRIIGCAGAFPLNHRNAFCECVCKSRRAFLRCCGMEAELSRARLRDGRTPFFKRCHAGVVELAVPVFHNGSLTGALFVGPFKAVGAAVSLTQRGSRENPASSAVLREALPSLDGRSCANLQVFAELLAARIEKSFAKELELSDDAPFKRRIGHFIDLNFRRDIQLSDLAKALGVGRVRACQILKAQFGEGFPKLLTARRLEHAKYLLKESMMKTGALSSESGFQDVSYFHRVFKRWNGCTPSEYRRKVQRGGVPDASLLA